MILLKAQLGGSTKGEPTVGRRSVVRKMQCRQARGGVMLAFIPMTC
jgi:hypothetical protein